MSRPLECGFHPSLPPELVAAPLEFDAWSQAQLLIEQSESTPIEPLYHYTAEEALKGIWESNGSGALVTCTTSDRTEFEYSLAIARRVISEVGQSQDGVTHHFCACLEDLLENNSFAEKFEFYLFSLSRHRDDMQQWQEYGQQGRGFAIGFAPTLFQFTPTELNGDESLPLTRRTTTRCARIYHFARMRQYIAGSSGKVRSSPCPSCPGCITGTRGYDYRKGQVPEHRSHIRHCRHIPRKQRS